ncbi:NLP-like protein [Plasmopara halstedii]|uniref:NLP-like protein n=1 Tax=Plasmopara halstedii TaxID=4781 RepID=A0A0P1AC60_PLAHL|nr:NLP-like protein [Plasmopara halstedii]CEG38402.1 NLP-like protein [Plasmopara halstedii]|eukprot:XP_024574771.1 NLP-like protein [Plasmopara halstedii]
MTPRAFLFGAITIFTLSYANGYFVFRSVDLDPIPDLIDANQVQPFPQPQPETKSQKSAVKYKPSLYIDSGCHPYPAVQANGSLSSGVEWKHNPRASCRGSPLGSQVYSRSDWYKGKWAIMYTWYFPGALDPTTQFVSHWLWAIIWTNSPDPDESTLLAVTLPRLADGVKKYSPLHSKYVHNHTTVKIKSQQSFWLKMHGFELTSRSGEFQDLITLDQLTDEAKAALMTNHRPEHFANPPLQDLRFNEVLQMAFPF